MGSCGAGSTPPCSPDRETASSTSSSSRPSPTNGTVGATVHKQGYVAAANAFLSFPSIGVNGNGKGVIAMTLMGPNNFPSAAQIAIDAAGKHGSVEIVQKGFRPEDGFTCYEAFVGPGAVCRWGDYSASVAGPTAGSTRRPR